MPASGAATVRPIQACQRCRKFKVGCDRARPTCRRCAKSRSECVYVASDVSIAPESAGKAYQQPRLQPPNELTPPATESSHKDLSSRSASPPEEAHEEAPASATSEGPYPCSSANFRSAELIPAKSHIRQPPKRDRAILSCIRCRKHKVRCDRRTPCGRCMKNNKESECIYSEFPGPEAPAEVEKPYKSLHGIATSFIDHRWDNRFRNVTHWTALLREIWQIRLHLPEHIKPVEREDECATSINAMSLSINFPLGDLNDPSVTVEDLLAQLPRRSVQRLFISYFMETVEKTFHIVDEAAYEQELRAFWMPGSVAQEDWLGVHFLILSLGCQAYNHHRIQKGLDVYPSLPARLLSGAEMCLKRTPFLFRPTLNVIKILSLMIIAKQIYAMSTHQADTCWHLTGMLVRLAASMGMHTDLAVSDEPTPYEEKTKRRMWTLAVYMEMKQSLVCGMPLLLRSSDIAALLKKEAFIDPINGSLGSALPMGLLEEMFANSGRLIAKAMELTTCVEDTVTYEEVVELDAALRTQLKRPETGLTRLHFSTGSVGSIDLETCMVDIFCRQTIMALHARFALQDQSSARYPVSYLSSLDQPQEIMLNALQSCRDVWSRERNHSVCNANAYNIVNLLVTSLRESHEK
ncbi:hypothetical protein LLEC1_03229 [Akanthomyces lecanii]|uniref:Zn(2)-C6 fungal-type domain-containing protein n=1 Tax=Cordyceps confragosa TaxID=2714763 RepID=A0A179IDZ6_CORDF|nr:hypothetical protein LLEC1_03229 [Akanthomyces lecanii]